MLYEKSNPANVKLKQVYSPITFTYITVSGAFFITLSRTKLETGASQSAFPSSAWERENAKLLWPEQDRSWNSWICMPSHMGTRSKTNTQADIR